MYLSLIPVAIAGGVSFVLLVCAARGIAIGVRAQAIEQQKRLGSIAMELRCHGETFQVWVAHEDKKTASSLADCPDQAEYIRGYDRVNKASLIRQYSETRRNDLLRLLAEAERLGFRDRALKRSVREVSTITELLDVGRRIQELGVRIQHRLSSN